MNVCMMILLSLAVSQAYAGEKFHPKSFSHENGKAVFVDFNEANYDINYDIKQAKAEVITQIKFEVLEKGYPIFDLLEEPTVVKIDGQDVGTSVIATPSQETSVRVIKKLLSPGIYTLEVKSPLKNLVEFTPTGVKSAFWVSDIEDRYYLERYLPTNLEFDQFKMTMKLHFDGLKAPQHVFANGDITWLDKETVRIEYPDYFSVNGPYFHITPEDSMDLLKSTYKSIDGRDLPVLIYRAKAADNQAVLQNFQIKTFEILKELENDYGAFPHPQVIIYSADLSSLGQGGMEYSGATVTDFSALSHELFHSYFGRGFMPANGNAGWIDEALASWRDWDYYSRPSLVGGMPIADGPYYARQTDTRAYNWGRSVVARLQDLLLEKGGVKPFLRKLIENNLFMPMTTEDFVSEMSLHFGEDLKPFFKEKVYRAQKSGLVPGEDHFHGKISPDQLKNLL